MLQTTELKRVFCLKENGKDLKLADPAPELSPTEVMNFYANTYPILTTSTIEGPIITDDEFVFIFKTTLGTKG